MPRRSKWLANIGPDDPVELAAARALDARLSLVWHYLPRAAQSPEDPENVHQLRVSTRRAMAAMNLFASLLPAVRAEWMTKALKRIRRAANDARDCDVLLDRLEVLAEQEPEGHYGLLVKCVAARRRQAQPAIVAAHAKLVRRDYPRRLAALLKRVWLRESVDLAERPTFAAAGRRSLDPLVEAFFAASEANLHVDVDHQAAALHAFRIQAKQVRYAMEIFSAAFAPSFRRELYPLVEQLQEKLGAVNDHVTAIAHLEDWLGSEENPTARAAIGELVEHEQRDLAERRQTFFDWWTAERRLELRVRFGHALTHSDPHDHAVPAADAVPTADELPTTERNAG